MGKQCAWIWEIWYVPNPMNKNIPPCRSTPGRFVGSGSSREYIKSFRVSSRFVKVSHSRNGFHFFDWYGMFPNSIAPGKPPFT